MNRRSWLPPFLLTALAGWLAATRPVATAPPGAAAVIQVVPVPVDPAEQLLLASLQGLANRDRARLWIESRGMNDRVLAELRAEAAELRRCESVWEALDRFRPEIAGAVLTDTNGAAINVATSLAGVLDAVILDVSLTNRFRALGRPLLADARGREPLALLDRPDAGFARGWAAHQDPRKRLHLRDFAVARRIFTFFEPGSDARVRTVARLGPGTRVLGWGRDEQDFVRDVSAGGGVVLPSDWSLNLSALQHLTVPLPVPERGPDPAPLGPSEVAVAFVVTDGDNLQFMGGGFVEAPGFWASPHRGKFPVTWEIPPAFATLAPRALAILYRTATPLDDFVAGPSGDGYWFPHHSPDRVAEFGRTAEALARAGVRLSTVLNSDGTPAETAALLARPEVDGILYKDYAPYHRRRGAVEWFHGKPVVAYRFLLWEKMTGADPDSVARALAALPRPGPRAGRLALVNAHAWSFRDSGGPLGAIARTVAALPGDVRVVTASTLFRWLREEGPAPGP
ncbi:MAG: hypothetical protein ACKOET_01175 [Verrucomicrobiota bacterium]